MAPEMIALLVNKGRGKGGDSKKCFTCGKPGHEAKDCRSGNKEKTPAKKCFTCGKSGHEAKDCRSGTPATGNPKLTCPPHMTPCKFKARCRNFDKGGSAKDGIYLRKCKH